ncbi:MAG: hypothetical protein KBT49_06495, partial [Bacteroidetes bacterium]|nr:hypothetical protein [Candidatus Colenecus caballi]
KGEIEQTYQCQRYCKNLYETFVLHTFILIDYLKYFLPENNKRANIGNFSIPYTRTRVFYRKYMLFAGAGAFFAGWLWRFLRLPGGFCQLR